MVQLYKKPKWECYKRPFSENWHPLQTRMIAGIKVKCIMGLLLCSDSSWELCFQHRTICVFKITTDKLQLAEIHFPACLHVTAAIDLKRTSALDLHRNGAFQIRFHRNESPMGEQPVSYMNSGGARRPTELPPGQYWSESEALKSRTSVWDSHCLESGWSKDLVRGLSRTLTDISEAPTPCLFPEGCPWPLTLSVDMSYVCLRRTSAKANSRYSRMWF